MGRPAHQPPRAAGALPASGRHGGGPVPQHPCPARQPTAAAQCPAPRCRPCCSCPRPLAPRYCEPASAATGAAASCMREVRVHGTFYQPMTFRHYPFDAQDLVGAPGCCIAPACRRRCGVPRQPRSPTRAALGCHRNAPLRAARCALLLWACFLRPPFFRLYPPAVELRFYDTSDIFTQHPAPRAAFWGGAFHPGVDLLASSSGKRLYTYGQGGGRALMARSGGAAGARRAGAPRLAGGWRAAQRCAALCLPCGPPPGDDANDWGITDLQIYTFVSRLGQLGCAAVLSCAAGHCRSAAAPMWRKSRAHGACHRRAPAPAPLPHAADGSNGAVV